MIVGSPIEKGYSLYKDLQTTYSTVQDCNEDCVCENEEEKVLQIMDSNKT